MPVTTPSVGRHTLRSTMRACVDGIDAAASRIYDAVCGTHPNVRCCHFQWLDVRDLHLDLHRVLTGVRGRVLDVRCGKKPYASWLPRGEGNRVVGLDIPPCPGVDVVVGDGSGFPFQDGAFDAVLCTQVLENVGDLESTLGEIHRVLVSSGLLVIPFIYQEQGASRDFRRFYRYEVIRLLSGRYEIVETNGQGGIGSTVIMLLLAWLNGVWECCLPLRVMKLPFLPVWLLVALVLNLQGLMLDTLNRTGAFYSNVMVVARKCPTQA